MRLRRGQEPAPEVWYRVDGMLWAAPADECGDASGPASPDIRVRELEVLRHTPKGVWVEGRHGRERFILHAATRRYACPNLAEALESFVERKRRQERILLRQIEHARKQAMLAINQAVQLRGEAEIYRKVAFWTVDAGKPSIPSIPKPGDKSLCPSAPTEA